MATPVTASAFALRPRNTTTVGTKAPYTDVVNDLHSSGSLPWASVDAVLGSANRTGAGHEMGISGFAQGWGWQDDDAKSSWFPQGITTSADSREDGLYNGRRVILVSWYENAARPPGKGVRISFVDMSKPSAPKYRHVLLVEPYQATGGTPNFAPVDIHAGGTMWYGDQLYVVDTDHGIRVFDTTKMMSVTATGDTETFGHQSGGYTAYNYRYVLPQTLAYVPLEPAKQPKPDPITWSFISLDRTTDPDSIVVGEYDPENDGTRLIRWEIDSATGLLKTVDGTATAVGALDVGIGRMQGATSINGKYYISRSNGDKPGEVLTLKPGNPVHSNDAPVGPEDLSYDRTTDWLWSLTEPTGNRFVFARTAGDLK
ncbi:MAG TPA: hypothetical protein VH912_21025 [Streptosporangiaceae bacterium]|jgi:hypothetical protein